VAEGTSKVLAKKGANRVSALQEILNPQPVIKEAPTPQDDRPALQDILNLQDPLVLGLVVQLVDSALQEDIVGMTQRLITKGRAVMGQYAAGGPTYDKIYPGNRTPAASAAAI